MVLLIRIGIRMQVSHYRKICDTKCYIEPDDEFARMLAGKQAKMLRMASRPNFDYVDVKR